MVTVNEIVEAINALLVEKYPDDAVYVNLLPKDFKRPSTLIELASLERADANRSTIAVKATFLLTCYTSVDGHYIQDMVELTKRQNGVIDIFACGYLKVADRFLQVQAASGGVEFGEGYVEVLLDYFDERPGIGDDAPLAESVTAVIDAGSD